MGIELSLGGWCLQEFCSIELGDDRLNKRLCKVAETLLNNPTAAIQTASGQWSEAKGAYRLFNNDKVSPDKLF